MRFDVAFKAAMRLHDTEASGEISGELAGDILERVSEQLVAQLDLAVEDLAVGVVLSTGEVEVEFAVDAANVDEALGRARAYMDMALARATREVHERLLSFDLASESVERTAVA